MTDKKFIFICTGARGCGKSERARKILGLTQEQYEEYCQTLDKMLKEECEHKKRMDEIQEAHGRYLATLRSWP